MSLSTTLALRWRFAGALLATAAAGCGGTSPVTTAPPAPVPAAASECVLGAGGAARGGDLVVAIAGPVDSALLARQRIDPPVRLDCLGRPRPALASAWSRDSSGKAWTLTLADAGTVAARWRAGSAAATLRYAGVESLVPVDSHRLVMTFLRVHDSLPEVLADPTLGMPRDSTSSLTLRALPVGDARDAIDRGADIVRSADPTVLDYAARRSGSVVAALPWDRTYALILPAFSPGLGAIPGRDTAAFRAALAGDAVRTEARAALAPFWWTSADCRSEGSAHASSPPSSSAVLYSRDDEVAGALAARLVAMSNAPGVIARGVEAGRLAAALRAGTDLAYVVALPRRALVPCRELSGWPAGASGLALIDTRARVVLRDGVPPLEMEYDGALRPVPGP